MNTKEVIRVDELIVYGFPWAGIGAALLWLLGRVVPEIKEGADKVLAAVWAVVGFLVVTNLPGLEQAWPEMPNVLPQVFTCIMILATTLGYVPGNVADKIKGKMIGLLGDK